MTLIDGRIPILVGVTGHRDLRPEDLGALGDAVGTILDRIEAQYPQTPLRLVTALAEGSDRLVAQQALNRGWAIIVPLPMPQRLYETQFESDESRQEFRTLLDRAELWFELPTVHRENNGTSHADPDMRKAQYESLGFFLVRYAQILIALWDGHANNDIGGTSHVVEMNLRSISSPAAQLPGSSPSAILDPWDRGLLHHVVTPRQSGRRPIGVAFEESTLYPESPDDQAEARSRLDATLARIDRFNEQLSNGASRLAAEAENSANLLLPAEVADALRPELKALLRRFGFADSLASRMQKRHRLSLGTLLLLVLVALGSFEAYDNLMPDSGDASSIALLVLAAYPVALAVAYFVYRIFRRSAYQDRHLDYRALAEGLRVQLFWNISAVGAEVSDHYLRKQSSELRWIHEAIRVSNVYAADWANQPIRDLASRESTRQTLTHWVHAQLGYYVRAAGRDATNLTRASWLATAFYAGSIGTTLLVLAVDGASRFRLDIDLLTGARPIMFMSIAMMLGLSALIRAYSEKMGYSEQALQYQRMRALFSRAERALSEGLARGDDTTIQKVLLELGEEALQENADWVLFRRSRGIEIPHG